MPDYRFVVNLRSDTLAEPFRESIPTPAYLLAADHATPGMRDLASGVREQDLDLFADNGNFELIGKAEAHFRDRAREVLQALRLASTSRVPGRSGTGQSALTRMSARFCASHRPRGRTGRLSFPGTGSCCR